jgi:hypothetical protein
MGYKMKGFSGFKESPIKQIKGDMPKSFNIQGSNWPDKTPGYSDTKAAKKAKAFKEFDKWHKKLDKTKSVISDPKAISTTKTTILPGGHHHKVTTGPEAMRPPKDAIVKSKKASKKIPKMDMTLNKNLNKAVKGTTKKVAKKAVKKGALQIAKQVGKRLLGPVGVALTAYDVVKTIPKVVKATKKSLKKEAKTGSTVGKPKY